MEVLIKSPSPKTLLKLSQKYRGIDTPYWGIETPSIDAHLKRVSKHKGIDTGLPIQKSTKEKGSFRYKYRYKKFLEASVSNHGSIPLNNKPKYTHGYRYR